VQRRDEPDDLAEEARRAAETGPFDGPDEPPTHEEVHTILGIVLIGFAILFWIWLAGRLT
jgi:hypothetical protein